MEIDQPRILIAEDDFFVAELVAEQIRQVGYIVAGTARDGREAVAMAKSLKPDAILMDIRMPKLDGIEAAEEIQKIVPTPVVILTAQMDIGSARKAAEAGIGAYLVKPASPMELARAVTIAMARFNDLMELRRLNSELQIALENVRTLSGLLPICSSCKRIRDDKGYWQRVELYIKNHSEARFTHGICPECMRKADPDAYEELLKKNPGAMGRMPPEQ